MFSPLNALLENSKPVARERELVNRRPVIAEKERGVWNFMIWSFFLSQMLGADGLLNGSARAASDGISETSADHASDADPRNGASAPDGSLLANGDAADAASAQSAALPLQEALGFKIGPNEHIVHASDSGDDAAALARLTGGHGALNAPAFGAAGEVSGAPDTGLDGLPVIDDLTAQLTLPLGDLLGDITQPLGSLIDDLLSGSTPVVGGLFETVGATAVGLGSTVTDLTSSVTATLDSVLDDVVGPLPIVGNALDAVDALVGDTVGTATATVDDIVSGVADVAYSLPVVSNAVEIVDAGVANTVGIAANVVGALTGIGQAGPGLDGIVGSSGSLTFESLPAVPAGLTNELFQVGRYTDYNLFLQSSDTSGQHLPVSSLTDLLDHALTALTVADASDAHDTAPSLPALPSVIDDLGLRGVGDWT